MPLYRELLVRLGVCTALYALVLTAFSQAFAAEFVNLDDDQNLVYNPDFRGLSANHLAWMFTTAHMGHYQPLTWVSFAVDHALFGLDAGAFHRTSVLLHGLVAIAFYFLACSLLALVVAPEQRRPRVLSLAAGVAAALFALHPLRVESVAWVTGRNDLIAAGFAFLCALFWLRYARARGAPGFDPRNAVGAGLAAAGAFALFVTSVDFSATGSLAPRNLGAAGVVFGLTAGALSVELTMRATRSTGGQGWLWASVACLVASFGGKASAMALPAALLVLDVWPLRRLRPAEPGRGVRACGLLVEKVPYLLVSAVFAVVAAWAKSGPGGGMRVLAEHSVGERLLQAAYGLAFYPAKTLLPTGLLPIYELPATVAASDPRFLVPLVGVLVATLFFVALRRRAPGLLAAWVSFALLAGPTLGFLQSGAQLVADRYAYLACAPFPILASAFVVHLASKGTRERVAVGALSGALVGVLLVLTVRQTARWRDSEALYASPGAERSPQLLTNLAMVRNGESHARPEQRAELLAEALRIEERAHRVARERDLFRPELWLHRGTILFNLGRNEEAVADLSKYVGLRPDFAGGRLNLGLALVRLERYREALPHLDSVTRTSPGTASAWRNLGLCLEATESPRRAVEAYRRAEWLEPGHSFVRERLRALRRLPR